jgi:transposase
MAILFVGIDLAKNVFAIHGVDEHGKAVLVRPSVQRARPHQLVAALPPCTVAMEACSGAHHWARLFAQHGHTVRLMAPKFVAPYRMSGKRGKNDAADAQAICEAVQRPSMRFVPMKGQDEQARLCIHRVRQGFVEQRTATINRLRGLLSEFGIVLAQKAATVRREAAAHLEDLPGWANTAVGDCLSEVHRLDERLAEYEQHISRMAGEDQRSSRLMRLLGGRLHDSERTRLDNRRRARLQERPPARGLAGPGAGAIQLGRQPRLGSITKAGDGYLRTLLVLGAKSVLAAARNKHDRLSRWALALEVRRGYWKAVVAIAAKNARMAWVVLAKGEDFKPIET